jgi:signal transduction histidine kinase
VTAGTGHPRQARRAAWSGWLARLAGRGPRRTIRLRLTLLYGVLFLVSGAALLALTYLLVASSLPVGLRVSGSAAPGQPLPSTSALQAQAGQQRTVALDALLVQSGIALAIMTVLSIGLGWVIAGRVLRPLRTITSAAQHTSASNLHERLALTGPDDELKELADTFDAFLGRLEGAFDAQRQFVANASHELRTPLARQRTLIEVALADPQPSVASLQAACGRALAASEQQERLIDALLTLARSQRGLRARVPIDVGAIARDVLEARRDDAERAGLTVRADLGAAPSAGDPRLAERLAANLIGNAIRHNVAGGWVSAGTAVRAGRAVLTVANSGPEVPPVQVGRLFEPFQRLGEDRVGSEGGSGLGLSIVKAVAAAHDAWVHARALPGGGLEVRVHFPAPPAAGSRPVAGPVAGVGAGPGEHRGSGDGLQAGHLPGSPPRGFTVLVEEPHGVSRGASRC